MEMISPNTFKENNKNKNYDELLKTKSELKEKIKTLEEQLNNFSSSIHSKEDLQLMIDMNKSYLVEIDNLLNLYLDKVKGCLIGGAIGDALGYPIEFIRSVDSIKNIYGENGITRYKLTDGKAIISDDTQMTLFTANGLIWGNTRYNLRGIAPTPVDCIYLAYQDWYQTQLSNYAKDKEKNKISWIADLPELNVERAPGITCLNALSGTEKGTLDKKINDSKGCGGIMRVAPIGLFFSNDNSHKIGKFGAEAAALTHSHPLGIIPAYVFSVLINTLTYKNKSLEEAVNYSLEVFKDNFKDYNKKESKIFLDLINKAIYLSKKDLDDINAIYELGQGWIAEEALAIAIYSCLKYPDNFEKAIVCSVNHDGDSDSTGSIAGNIMGALLGLKNIPEYYINDLELKDVILELAEDLFVDCPVSEYGTNNDEYWLSKYLYCKRDLTKKK